MRITQINPDNDYRLSITFDDGQCGIFDVTPYLEYDVFRPLKDVAEFRRVRNGGYYIEWTCGADLSTDTLAAHLVCEV